MQKLASKVKPIKFESNSLYLLDQRIIPYEKKYVELKTYKEVISAIKDMVLRGAPLIGITAGYAMVLGANEVLSTTKNPSEIINKLKRIGDEIKDARPTAVNLLWAVDLIIGEISNLNDTELIFETIKNRAAWIHSNDEERCLKMGEHGSKLINSGDGILTICNTGALATGGIGTAFGVIQTAFSKNQNIKIYAAETRPRQQGARLTTFEFKENDIPCTLVPDTACGYAMQKGLINLVIAGADRIAANGDSANKIGTYQLAVLAKENNIPFYIAAPLSTIDLKTKTGEGIPIEERSQDEVTIINENLICPKNTIAFNPAFDVTPAKYISGIITEKGILRPNFSDSISMAFNENVVV